MSYARHLCRGLVDCPCLNVYSSVYMDMLIDIEIYFQLGPLDGGYVSAVVALNGGQARL